MVWFYTAIHEFPVELKEVKPKGKQRINLRTMTLSLELNYSGEEKVKGPGKATGVSAALFLTF